MSSRECLSPDDCFGTTSQWGAADAEIKVPSDENTELTGFPFKTWGPMRESRLYEEIRPKSKVRDYCTKLAMHEFELHAVPT